ncbi:SUMF1/EgtB/PvdO family nonheme iron enzyme, partial [Nocardia farcinica]|uniref:SUMF1/EgtB/PvdO family nonheme iron enzyme n=1 Tax=Nocardia farcinica TaxID=37329 RepID=UPI003CC7FA99
MSPVDISEGRSIPSRKSVPVKSAIFHRPGGLSSSYPSSRLCGARSGCGGEKPPDRPAGPGDRRGDVVRGGSYLCHESYCNRYRVAPRTGNHPDATSGHLGFRRARDRAVGAGQPPQVWRPPKKTDAGRLGGGGRPPPPHKTEKP